MRLVMARLAEFVARLLWMLASAVLAYSAVVQLGLTGEYPSADIPAAGINALGSAVAAAAGVGLVSTRRRRSGTLLAVAAFCMAIALVPLSFGSRANGAMPLGVVSLVTAAIITIASRHVPRRAAAPAPRSTSRLDPPTSSAIDVVSWIGVGLASIALLVIAVRSAVTLNIRWDTFMYHLPFDAEWGGLPIRYDMNDTMRPRFEGFPPLPHIVQGLLWRLTGSVNATGVVNFAALAIFLGFCGRILRAPVWLVALVSLTAPMVVIHASSSYVDLFGNAFLAMGFCSCLAMYLRTGAPTRTLLVSGLLGFAAAAWSKFLLAPLAGLGMLLLAALVLRDATDGGFGRRRAGALILAFMLAGSIPYAKNLVLYGNPFWPTRVPVVGALFPYVHDDLASGESIQRPASLVGAPQPVVFVRSILEIGVPTSYEHRPRWIIDQGNATDGFRMGGFWGIGAATFMALAAAGILLHDRRRGAHAVAAGVGLLALVSALPQSNELRYYMFLPLVWAASIGMTFPSLRSRTPRAAAVIPVVVMSMFGHMVVENAPHYRIEPMTYRDAAIAWGAAEWWPLLRPSQTYCVVDMMPLGIMLTGPTMTEYTIVDRSDSSLCPPGASVTAE